VLLFVSTTVVQYFLTERERRQIKSAFQHYVPAKVVDEITQNYEKLKLGGDKRELTVLFSDIRGFTSISEALAPEDLVRLLNTYLTRMTEQVFKHDGLLDKYIGDAIMAVYGAPIHRPDHALLACQTALDMMRELRVLQEQWKQENRPTMRIGIGINTGPMIVGNMGSVNRFDYTVIGDAVNLGSRIEHLNKDYGTQILISEFTHQQAREHLRAVREVDETQVRGREQPVRLYELIPDGEYKNLDWLGDFETARAHFHAGRTAKAKPIFDKLVKAVNDPVSRYYLSRIQARKQT
jgi:adenylate cyclase